MSGWTDEKIEELKRLWAEGLTTGEIGKRLDFSKNAVVGKAHRLGLESRPSPIKRSGENTNNGESESKKAKTPVEKTPQPTKAKVQKEEPVKKAEPVPVKNKETKLEDLTNNSCRWPIGDPKEEGFHFCGKETFNGKPYCLEHCATAYVGINKKGS